jgi:antitoxin HicB
MNYGFALRWSEEDNGYIAVCTDFPGVSAFGETAEEALHEAQVALDAAIATANDEEWPLPEPRSVEQYSGQFRLRLPRKIHADLARLAQEEGVSLNALAAAFIARGVGYQEAVREIVSEAAHLAPGTRPVRVRSDRR